MTQNEKWMYSHRKQISAFLEMRLEGMGRRIGTKGRDYKRARDNFWRDRYVHLLDYCDGSIGMHMLKLIKLYTLNITVYYMSIVP